MQTFINIKVDTDCRWRRVIDGQLKDKSPNIGSDIDFWDIENSAIAYVRDAMGSHIFLCTKKMEQIKGSIRPKLLAILNDSEFLFNGRIVKQLCLPTWFERLGEDNDRKKTIISELPDFSKWICDKNSDVWVSPDFHMTLLAQIVDKLLTAINKNERAKVVLACNQQNLEKAQELLYYVLRCLPVKMSNRLAFNTAAKDITLFDICCGDFSEKDVDEAGGVRIDIEKVLSDECKIEECNLFVNSYAEYIRMLKKDTDPCETIENTDNVDTLNSIVKEKVIEVTSKLILEKCKTCSITAGELKDFAESAKNYCDLVKKNLQKIADYLCLNYVGFTSCYCQLPVNSQKFYLSFVADKGRAIWNCGANIDLLFSQNDAECNSAYIKSLYGFWCGEGKKTVYKNHNAIGQFLFNDYDARFVGNDSLSKAFETYWNSMNENDLIDFLKHGDALNAEIVFDYIIRRNGTTTENFIEYCCKLKSDKNMDGSIVDKIYNKYLQELIKCEDSVESLELALTNAEKNSIQLKSDIFEIIQDKVNDERSKHRSQIIAFLSHNNQIQGLNKTKKKDKRIVKKRQKRKGIGGKVKLADEVIVYNLARLSERDCGEAGTINNANWAGRLKILSTFVGIFFVLQIVALGLADFFLLNKLYIFGKVFWIEIALTAGILLLGSIVWGCFGVKIYLQDGCDNEQFESESSKMLKWLFALCVITTIIKVVLAILSVIVF